MDYQAYIASTEWAKKREERKALDDFKCRLCDHDGSLYRLEVHHRPSSYAKIPHESVERDLITVCARCHELITCSIRSDRYATKVLPDISIVISQVHERIDNHGMERSKLSVDISLPVTSTQRANSGSDKQVVKSDQNDIIKARQNRRGL